MCLFTTSFVILTVVIKRRSRVPGVVITQYVEEIPPGKSTPDFIRKPMGINIQEGIQTTFSVDMEQKLHDTLINIQMSVIIRQVCFMPLNMCLCLLYLENRFSDIWLYGYNDFKLNIKLWFYGP